MYNTAHSLRSTGQPAKGKASTTTATTSTAVASTLSAHAAAAAKVELNEADTAAGTSTAPVSSSAPDGQKTGQSITTTSTTRRTTPPPVRSHASPDTYAKLFSSVTASRPASGASATRKAAPGSSASPLLSATQASAVSSALAESAPLPFPNGTNPTGTTASASAAIDPCTCTSDLFDAWITAWVLTIPPPNARNSGAAAAEPSSSAAGSSRDTASSPKSVERRNQNKKLFLQRETALHAAYDRLQDAADALERHLFDLRRRRDVLSAYYDVLEDDIDAAEAILTEPEPEEDVTSSVFANHHGPHQGSHFHRQMRESKREKPLERYAARRAVAQERLEKVYFVIRRLEQLEGILGVHANGPHDEEDDEDEDDDENDHEDNSYENDGRGVDGESRAQRRLRTRQERRRRLQNLLETDDTKDQTRGGGAAAHEDGEDDFGGGGGGGGAHADRGAAALIDAREVFQSVGGGGGGASALHIASGAAAAAYDQRRLTPVELKRRRIESALAQRVSALRTQLQLPCQPEDVVSRVRNELLLGFSARVLALRASHGSDGSGSAPLTGSLAGSHTSAPPQPMVMNECQIESFVEWYIKEIIDPFALSQLLHIVPAEYMVTTTTRLVYGSDANVALRASRALPDLSHVMLRAVSEGRLDAFAQLATSPSVSYLQGKQDPLSRMALLYVGLFGGQLDVLEQLVGHGFYHPQMLLGMLFLYSNWDEEASEEAAAASAARVRAAYPTARQARAGSGQAPPGGTPRGRIGSVGFLNDKARTAGGVAASSPSSSAARVRGANRTSEFRHHLFSLVTEAFSEDGMQRRRQERHYRQRHPPQAATASTGGGGGGGGGGVTAQTAAAAANTTTLEVLADWEGVMDPADRLAAKDLLRRLGQALLVEDDVSGVPGAEATNRREGGARGPGRSDDDDDEEEDEDDGEDDAEDGDGDATDGIWGAHHHHNNNNGAKGRSGYPTRRSRAVSSTRPGAPSLTQGASSPGVPLNTLSWMFDADTPMIGAQSLQQVRLLLRMVRRAWLEMDQLAQQRLDALLSGLTSQSREPPAASSEAAVPGPAPAPPVEAAGAGGRNAHVLNRSAPPPLFSNLKLYYGPHFATAVAQHQPSGMFSANNTTSATATAAAGTAPTASSSAVMEILAPPPQATTTAAARRVQDELERATSDPNTLVWLLDSRAVDAVEVAPLACRLTPAFSTPMLQRVDAWSYRPLRETLYSPLWVCADVPMECTPPLLHLYMADDAVEELEEIWARRFAGLFSGGKRAEGQDDSTAGGGAMNSSSMLAAQADKQQFLVQMRAFQRQRRLRAQTRRQFQQLQHTPQQQQQQRVVMMSADAASARPSTVTTASLGTAPRLLSEPVEPSVSCFYFETHVSLDYLLLAHRHNEVLLDESIALEASCLGNASGATSPRAHGQSATRSYASASQTSTVASASHQEPQANSPRAAKLAVPNQLVMGWCSSEFRKLANGRETRGAAALGALGRAEGHSRHGHEDHDDADGENNNDVDADAHSDAVAGEADLASSFIAFKTEAAGGRGQSRYRTSPQDGHLDGGGNDRRRGNETGVNGGISIDIVSVRDLTSPGRHDGEETARTSPDVAAASHGAPIEVQFRLLHHQHGRITPLYRPQTPEEKEEAKEKEELLLRTVFCPRTPAPNAAGGAANAPTKRRHTAATLNFPAVTPARGARKASAQMDASFTTDPLSTTNGVSSRAAAAAGTRNVFGSPIRLASSSRPRPSFFANEPSGDRHSAPAMVHGLPPITTSAESQILFGEHALVIGFLVDVLDGRVKLTINGELLEAELSGINHVMAADAMHTDGVMEANDVNPIAAVAAASTASESVGVAKVCALFPAATLQASGSVIDCLDVAVTHGGSPRAVFQFAFDTPRLLALEATLNALGRAHTTGAAVRLPPCDAFAARPSATMMSVLARDAIEAPCDPVLLDATYKFNRMLRVLTTVRASQISSFTSTASTTMANSHTSSSATASAAEAALISEERAQDRVLAADVLLQRTLLQAQQLLNQASTGGLLNSVMIAPLRVPRRSADAVREGLLVLTGAAGAQEGGSGSGSGGGGAEGHPQEASPRPDDGGFRGGGTASAGSLRGPTYTILNSSDRLSPLCYAIAARRPEMAYTIATHVLTDFHNGSEGAARHRRLALQASCALGYADVLQVLLERMPVYEVLEAFGLRVQKDIKQQLRREHRLRGQRATRRYLFAVAEGREGGAGHFSAAEDPALAASKTDSTDASWMHVPLPPSRCYAGAHGHGSLSHHTDASTGATTTTTAANANAAMQGGRTTPLQASHLYSTHRREYTPLHLALLGGPHTDSVTALLNFLYVHLNFRRRVGGATTKSTRGDDSKGVRRDNNDGSVINNDDEDEDENEEEGVSTDAAQAGKGDGAVNASTKKPFSVRSTHALFREAINVSTPSGESALLMAIRYGLEGTAERLLRLGADAGCMDRTTTAYGLEIACSNRSNRIAALLLDLDVYQQSLHMINHAGVATPLCWCALSNAPDLIVKLLARGASTSLGIEGNTPLQLAVMFGNEAAAQALLTACTSLTEAAQATALAKRGGVASPNLSTGRAVTAGVDTTTSLLCLTTNDTIQPVATSLRLHDAQSAKAQAMDATLVASQALSRPLLDVDAADARTQFTALHVACETGLLSVVQGLLRRRASLMVLTKVSCQTPLHLALVFGHEEVAMALLTYGKDQLRRGKVLLDIAVADKNGDTPLHLACKAGCVSAVDYILTQYSAAEVDKALSHHQAQKQKQGIAEADQAVGRRTVSPASAPHTTSPGSSPHPAHLGHDELSALAATTAGMPKATCANVLAENNSGKTPLLLAIQSGVPSVAELVITAITELPSSGDAQESLGGPLVDGTCLALHYALSAQMRDVMLLLLSDARFPASPSFKNVFLTAYRSAVGQGEVLAGDDEAEKDGNPALQGGDAHGGVPLKKGRQTTGPAAVDVDAQLREQTAKGYLFHRATDRRTADKLEALARMAPAAELTVTAPDSFERSPSRVSGYSSSSPPSSPVPMATTAVATRNGRKVTRAPGTAAAAARKGPAAASARRKDLASLHQRRRSSYIRGLLARSVASAIPPMQSLHMLLRGFALPELYVMLSEIAEESATIGIQTPSAMLYGEMISGFLLEHHRVVIAPNRVVTFSRDALTTLNDAIADVFAASSPSTFQTPRHTAEAGSPRYVTDSSTLPSWLVHKDVVKAALSRAPAFCTEVFRLMRLYGVADAGSRILDELDALVAGQRVDMERASTTGAAGVLNKKAFTQDTDLDNKASEAVDTQTTTATTTTTAKRGAEAEQSWLQKHKNAQFTEEHFTSPMGYTALQLAASLGLAHVVDYLLREFPHLSPLHVPRVALLSADSAATTTEKTSAGATQQQQQQQQQQRPLPNVKATTMKDVLIDEVTDTSSANAELSVKLHDTAGFSERKWLYSPFRLAVQSGVPGVVTAVMTAMQDRYTRRAEASAAAAAAAAVVDHDAARTEKSAKHPNSTKKQSTTPPKAAPKDNDDVMRMNRIVDVLTPTPSSPSTKPAGAASPTRHHSTAELVQDALAQLVNYKEPVWVDAMQRTALQELIASRLAPSLASAPPSLLRRVRVAAMEAVEAEAMASGGSAPSPSSAEDVASIADTASARATATMNKLVAAASVAAVAALTTSSRLSLTTSALLMEVRLLMQYGARVCGLFDRSGRDAWLLAASLDGAVGSRVCQLMLTEDVCDMQCLMTRAATGPTRAAESRTGFSASASSTPCPRGCSLALLATLLSRHLGSRSRLMPSACPAKELLHTKSTLLTAWRANGYGVVRLREFTGTRSGASVTGGRSTTTGEDTTFASVSENHVLGLTENGLRYDDDEAAEAEEMERFGEDAAGAAVFGELAMSLKEGDSTHNAWRGGGPGDHSESAVTAEAGFHFAALGTPTINAAPSAGAGVVSSSDAIASSSSTQARVVQLTAAERARLCFLVHRYLTFLLFSFAEHNPDFLAHTLLSQQPQLLTRTLRHPASHDTLLTLILKNAVRRLAPSQSAREMLLRLELAQQQQQQQSFLISAEVPPATTTTTSNKKTKRNESPALTPLQPNLLSDEPSTGAAETADATQTLLLLREMNAPPATAPRDVATVPEVKHLVDLAMALLHQFPALQMGVHESCALDLSASAEFDLARSDLMSYGTRSRGGGGATVRLSQRGERAAGADATTESIWQSSDVLTSNVLGFRGALHGDDEDNSGDGRSGVGETALSLAAQIGYVPLITTIVCLPQWQQQQQQQQQQVQLDENTEDDPAQTLTGTTPPSSPHWPEGPIKPHSASEEDSSDDDDDDDDEHGSEVDDARDAVPGAEHAKSRPPAPRRIHSATTAAWSPSSSSATTATTVASAVAGVGVSDSAQSMTLPFPHTHGLNASRAAALPVSVAWADVAQYAATSYDDGSSNTARTLGEGQHTAASSPMMVVDEKSFKALLSRNLEDPLVRSRLATGVYYDLDALPTISSILSALALQVDGKARRVDFIRSAFPNLHPLAALRVAVEYATAARHFLVPVECKNAFWVAVLYAQFTDQLNPLDVTAKTWNLLLRHLLPTAPAVPIFLLQKRCPELEKSRLRQRERRRQWRRNLEAITQTARAAARSATAVSPHKKKNNKAAHTSPGAEKRLNQVANNSATANVNMSTKTTTTTTTAATRITVPPLSLTRGGVPSAYVSGPGSRTPMPAPSSARSARASGKKPESTRVLSNWFSLRRRADIFLHLTNMTIAESWITMKNPNVTTAAAAAAAATGDSASGTGARPSLRNTLLLDVLELAVRYDEVPVFRALTQLQMPSAAPPDNLGAILASMATAAEKKAGGAAPNAGAIASGSGGGGPKNNARTSGGSKDDGHGGIGNNTRFTLHKKVLQYLDNYSTAVWVSCPTLAYAALSSAMHANAVLQRMNDALWFELLEERHVDLIAVAAGSRHVLESLYWSPPQGARPYLSSWRYDRIDARTGLPEGMTFPVAAASGESSASAARAQDNLNQTMASLVATAPFANAAASPMMHTGAAGSTAAAPPASARSEATSMAGAPAAADATPPVSPATRARLEEEAQRERERQARAEDELNFARSCMRVGTSIFAATAARQETAKVTWGLGAAARVVDVSAARHSRTVRFVTPEDNGDVDAEADAPADKIENAATTDAPTAMATAGRRSTGGGGGRGAGTAPAPPLGASGAKAGKRASAVTKGDLPDSSRRASRARLSVRSSGDAGVDTDADVAAAPPEPPRWFMYLQNDWVMHAALSLHSPHPSRASMAVVTFLMNLRAPLSVSLVDLFLSSAARDGAALLPPPSTAANEAGTAGNTMSGSTPSLWYATPQHDDSLLHLLVINDQCELAEYYLAAALYLFSQAQLDEPTLQPGRFTIRETNARAPSTGSSDAASLPTRSRDNNNNNSDTDEEEGEDGGGRDPFTSQTQPVCFLRFVLRLNRHGLTAFDYARSAGMVQLLQQYGCVPPTYRPNPLTFLRALRRSSTTDNAGSSPLTLAPFFSVPRLLLASDGFLSLQDSVQNSEAIHAAAGLRSKSRAVRRQYDRARLALFQMISSNTTITPDGKAVDRSGMPFTGNSASVRTTPLPDAALLRQLLQTQKQTRAAVLPILLDSQVSLLHLALCAADDELVIAQQQRQRLEQQQQQQQQQKADKTRAGHATGADRTVMFADDFGAANGEEEEDGGAATATVSASGKVRRVPRYNASLLPPQMHAASSNSGANAAGAKSGKASVGNTTLNSTLSSVASAASHATTTASTLGNKTSASGGSGGGGSSSAPIRTNTHPLTQRDVMEMLEKRQFVTFPLYLPPPPPPPTEEEKKLQQWRQARVKAKQQQQTQKQRPTGSAGTTRAATSASASSSGAPPFFRKAMAAHNADAEAAAVESSEVNEAAILISLTPMQLAQGLGNVSRGAVQEISSAAHPSPQFTSKTIRLPKAGATTATGTGTTGRPSSASAAEITGAISSATSSSVTQRKSTDGGTTAAAAAAAATAAAAGAVIGNGLAVTTLPVASPGAFVMPLEDDAIDCTHADGGVVNNSANANSSNVPTFSVRVGLAAKMAAQLDGWVRAVKLRSHRRALAKSGTTTASGDEKTSPGQGKRANSPSDAAAGEDRESVNGAGGAGAALIVESIAPVGGVATAEQQLLMKALLRYFASSSMTAQLSKSVGLAIAPNYDVTAAGDAVAAVRALKANATRFSENL